MITLDNPNYNEIYTTLSQTPQSFGFNLPGDEWKQGLRELEGKERDNQIPIVAKFGPIELITPLNFVNQFFVKSSGKYRSILEVHARQKKVFEGLSGQYQRELSERGLLFYPSSNDLTGYIFDNKQEKKKVPLAVILSDQEDSLRAIGLGTFGARARKFQDLEDFAIENGRLNLYANLLISSVYSKFIPREIKQGLPEIVLSLN